MPVFQQFEEPRCNQFIKTVAFVYIDINNGQLTVDSSIWLASKDKLSNNRINKSKLVIEVNEYMKVKEQYENIGH